MFFINGVRGADCLGERTFRHGVPACRTRSRGVSCLWQGGFIIFAYKAMRSDIHTNSTVSYFCPCYAAALELRKWTVRSKGWGSRMGGNICSLLSQACMIGKVSH